MNQLPHSDTIRRQRSEIPLSEVLLSTPSMTSDQWQSLSLIIKWLVMARAPVLVMTIAAVLTGLLVAGSDGFFKPDFALALVIGLTFTHASHNMLNDLIDSRSGLDTGEYFRVRYGVHVLAQGLISDSRLFLIAVTTAVPAMLSGAYLVWQCGMEVLYLAILGSLFMVFYSWPLKHWALGEFSVLIVWGPLMVAGSYFVMTGTLTVEILTLSLIYGLGPTLVIMGQHIDKLEEDREAGVVSLPVLLGSRSARTITRLLVIAQGLLVLVAVGIWHDLAGLLLTFLLIPRALVFFRIYGEARPSTRPADYPRKLWPLWYSAYAFGYMRLFLLFILMALTLKLILNLMGIL